MQLLFPATPAQPGAQSLAGGVEGLLAMVGGAMGETGSEQGAASDPAAAFAQALAGAMMVQPQAAPVVAATKPAGSEDAPACAARAPDAAIPQTLLAPEGDDGALQATGVETGLQTASSGTTPVPQGAAALQPDAASKPAVDAPPVPAAEPPPALAEAPDAAPQASEKPLPPAPPAPPAASHAVAERTVAPRAENREATKAEDKPAASNGVGGRAEVHAAPTITKSAVTAIADASAQFEADDHGDPEPGPAIEQAGEAHEGPAATFTAEARPAPLAADAPKTGGVHTVAHLAAQIVRKVESRTTRFDVQLDPAGLGKVDVRIEIGARGELSAALSFDNPQAAAELRGRAGELQRALEQAGFDISRGGLSFDLGGGQGNGQGLWDQQAQQTPIWRGAAFIEDTDLSAEPMPARRSPAAGRIDVMV